MSQPFASMAIPPNIRQYSYLHGDQGDWSAGNDRTSVLRTQKEIRKAKHGSRHSPALRACSRIIAMIAVSNKPQPKDLSAAHIPPRQDPQMVAEMRPQPLGPRG